MDNKRSYKKYTKESLEEAVLNSTSISGVLRFFGTKLTGGNHSYLTSLIKSYKIDTSHFLGFSHNKGKPSLRKKSPDEILKINDDVKRTDRRFLYRALIESGIEYTCKLCNLKPKWKGKPLTLEIDHVNGVINDNRIENLRFVCPNCHSQLNNFNIIRTNKITKKCTECEAIINKKSTMCTKCSLKNMVINRYEKVKNKPTRDELSKMLWEKPTTKIAEQYGVSDKSVEKWAKKYELTKPPRGYWTKKKYV